MLKNAKQTDCFISKFGFPNQTKKCYNFNICLNQVTRFRSKEKLRMMEVEDCLLAEDSEEHEDGGEHGDIS